MINLKKDRLIQILLQDYNINIMAELRDFNVTSANSLVHEFYHVLVNVCIKKGFTIHYPARYTI